MKKHSDLARAERRMDSCVILGWELYDEETEKDFDTPCPGDS